MAEILSTETFDPNSPASRVARTETLLNHKDFQWYLDQLREREKALVARALSVTATSAERDQAVLKLAGLREALNFVGEEYAVAVKHLKEEIHREDPTTPKPGPVL